MRFFSNGKRSICQRRKSIPVMWSRRNWSSMSLVWSSCRRHRQFEVEPYRSRLRNEPWSRRYETIDRADQSQERTFRIVRPCDIYLDGDHQCALDLRPLNAPDEPELTKFCERFGAKWLSECGHRTLIHRDDRTGKAEKPKPDAKRDKVRSTNAWKFCSTSLLTHGENECCCTRRYSIVQFVEPECRGIAKCSLEWTHPCWRR